MSEVFGRDPRQPEVTCLECGTKLGEGTTKDVFSHLVTCLQVAPNSLENIADTARDTKNEHGRRVLYIVEQLQESITDGAIAARDRAAIMDTPKAVEGDF